MSMEKHDEIECWDNCYSQPLTLGLPVQLTDDSILKKFDTQERRYMVTSLSVDSQGVLIGISDLGDWSSRPSWTVRIDDIQPVGGANG